LYKITVLNKTRKLRLAAHKNTSEAHRLRNTDRLLFTPANSLPNSSYLINIFMPEFINFFFLKICLNFGNAISQMFKHAIRQFHLCGSRNIYNFYLNPKQPPFKAIFYFTLILILMHKFGRIRWCTWHLEFCSTNYGLQKLFFSNRITVPFQWGWPSVTGSFSSKLYYK